MVVGGGGLQQHFVFPFRKEVEVEGSSGGGGGGGLQTYICYHVAALMISFNLISL